MGGGLNRRFLDLAGWAWLEEAVFGLGGDDFFVDVDGVAVEDDGTGEVDRTLSLMEGPPPSGLLGDGMGLRFVGGDACLRDSERDLWCAKYGLH